MSVLAQATARGDFHLRRGVSNRFGVRWEHSADGGASFAPVDLTGWELTCALKSLHGAPLLTMPVGGDSDGFAVTDLAPGALDGIGVSQGKWEVEGHQLDPDVTNYFQGISGSGQWVEVNRNLWSGSEQSRTRGPLVPSQATLTPTRSGGLLEIAGDPAGAISYVYTASSGRVPVAAGRRFSWRVPLRNAGKTPFPVSFYTWIEGNPNSGGTTSNVSQKFILAPGEEREVLIEGYLAGQNAVDIRFSLYYAAADQKPPVGAKLLLLDGASLNEGVSALPRLHGSMPPGSVDPDMRQRWVGQPGNSETVIEIEAVRGVNGSSCIVGLSRVGTKPAVRLISRASSYGFASIPIPPGARGGGTIRAIRHQEAVITSGPAQRGIGSNAPFEVEPFVNRVGAGEIALRFSRRTGTFSAYLYHGGHAGQADVRYTDIGLFAGDYDGPAFSGDDPPTETHAYRWAAAPFESVAIRYRTAPHVIERLGDGYFYLEG